MHRNAKTNQAINKESNFVHWLCTYRHYVFIHISMVTAYECIALHNLVLFCLLLGEHLKLPLTPNFEKKAKLMGEGVCFLTSYFWPMQGFYNPAGLYP